MTNDYDRPTWIDHPAERLNRKNAFDGSLVMGTAAFNRDTGRLRTRSRPFAWAVDKDTGLIRADLLRSRRCPVCQSLPGAGLFVKDGFRHVKCPDCGLIYVSLILREDVMDKYWREELAWLGVLNSGPQMEMDRKKFLYGLELATAYIQGAGRRLLDIGAGSGLFVRLAEERGWQVTALEMNRESSAKLAGEGIQVIVKPLELADLPPRSFHLIALWEVLEHLADPRAVLLQAGTLLAPGGVFLIMVPNAQSLVTRLLRERSNTFGGHSHLNHFSQDSLTRLLKNFKILDIETVITELGAINNYLSFQDPYEGEAETALPELTPELLHRRLWGSRLLVVAAREDEHD